jgi:hypothetical protein
MSLTTAASLDCVSESQELAAIDRVLAPVRSSGTSPVAAQSAGSGGGSASTGTSANDFEICVIDADGSNMVQLTNNLVPDLTPTWSPDGQRLVFHRPVPMQGNQLFTMEPTLGPGGTPPAETQLTSAPGGHLLANWGQLRVTGDQPAP